MLNEQKNVVFFKMNKNGFATIKIENILKEDHLMITKIGTVAVYVEDQQKAKEFWVNKAGFEVIA